MEWKHSKDLNSDYHYKIVAADVKALYPNLRKDLVKLALQEALKTCSNMDKNGQKIICDMCILCLDNIIIQFRDKFYNQKTGIVTGENNSVSNANIALHYIIRKLPQINTTTKIFKRFIDDIVFIAEDDNNVKLIKESLTVGFRNFDLELTFREITTYEEGKQIEFLDVLHVANHTAEKNFITKDFVKPTAKEATFLHGKSFHPKHVFEGIIKSESKRLRMLNETNEGYQESIKRLELKCLKSGFKSKTVKTMINMVKNYDKTSEISEKETEEMKPKESQEQKKKKFDKQTLPWTTRFKSLLRFNSKEKELKPNAMLTYRRPTTLAGILTNYKGIAHEVKTIGESCSQACGRCALCGNWGNHKNMVYETKELVTKEKEIIHLKQQIKCYNYGIYAAQCQVCKEIYVGQTINPFSTRWNKHRSIWKEEILEKTSNKIEEWKTTDDHALTNHYLKFHRDLIKNGKKQLAEAYKVAFVETPKRKEDLDMAESCWVAKLKARINIAPTILPRHR